MDGRERQEIEREDFELTHPVVDVRDRVEYGYAVNAMTTAIKVANINAFQASTILAILFSKQGLTKEEALEDIMGNWGAG